MYRGQVFGALVAIKRLKEGSAEWEVKQFASEMALLIRVSHRSICRLFAFSTDGPQRCLVLELCTGGALDTRLSCRATGTQQPPAPLGWQQRVHIAFDVASALSYLHALTPQMIHRYASTNLLLLSLALLDCASTFSRDTGHSLTRRAPCVSPTATSRRPTCC